MLSIVKQYKNHNSVMLRQFITVIEFYNFLLFCISIFNIYKQGNKVCDMFNFE